MGGITNLTNLTRGNMTAFDLVEYTNTVTDGIMMQGFIITVFVILTSMFVNRYGLEKSILVSSFLSMMISIALSVIGLLNFYYMIFFAVLMIFSGFWVYFSTR